MRRIYLFISLIMCGLCFYAGMQYANKDLKPDSVVTDLRKKQDSLTSVLLALKVRDKILADSIRASKNKNKSNDSIIAVMKRSQERAARKYQAEIKSVETYNNAELDSFFVAHYPDTIKARNSFNQKARDVVIPEWRARSIVQDRIRLDSVSQVAAMVPNLEQANKDRDNTIRLQDHVIANNEMTISTLTLREDTWKREAVHWEGKSRKYKRQRDIVAGVGGALVVVVVLKSLTGR